MSGLIALIPPSKGATTMSFELAERLRRMLQVERPKVLLRHASDSSVLQTVEEVRPLSPEL